MTWPPHPWVVFLMACAAACLLLGWRLLCWLDDRLTAWRSVDQERQTAARAEWRRRLQAAAGPYATVPPPPQPPSGQDPGVAIGGGGWTMRGLESTSIFSSIGAGGGGGGSIGISGGGISGGGGSGGAVIVTQAAVPTASGRRVGDIYHDIATGQVWQWSGSLWWPLRPSQPHDGSGSVEVPVEPKEGRAIRIRENGVT